MKIDAVAVDVLLLLPRCEVKGRDNNRRERDEEED
jgi:hypothetical protein